MARRRKKSLGMHHRKAYVNRMAYRTGSKKLNFTVTLQRSATGMYSAIACAAHKGKKVKARHCGALAGGPTPAHASARALRNAADTIERYGR